MKNQSYSEKLRNPLWQKKRLDIFSRDKFSCTKCKSTLNNIQVHHLDYIPGIDPWDYPEDMLITLCDQCHELENKRPKHEQDLLTSLKMNGFLAYDVWHLATKLYVDQRFCDHIKAVLRK